VPYDQQLEIAKVMSSEQQMIEEDMITKNIEWRPWVTYVPS
jgi:hypothetical protein